MCPYMIYHLRFINLQHDAVTASVSFNQLWDRWAEGLLLQSRAVYKIHFLPLSAFTRQLFTRHLIWLRFFLVVLFSHFFRREVDSWYDISSHLYSLFLFGQRPRRDRWPMISHIWGIFSSSFSSFSSVHLSICRPPPQIPFSRPKSQSWGPNPSLKAQILASRPKS